MRRFTAALVVIRRSRIAAASGVGSERFQPRPQRSSSNGHEGVRAAVVASGLLATGALAASVVNTEAQQPGPPTGTLQLGQRDRDTTFRSGSSMFRPAKVGAEARHPETAP
jgi:hypothetical protein